MMMLRRGDHVEKIKGYKWPGVVVAAFETTAGEQRVVVECTVPEVAGALHIYSPDQLQRRKRNTIMSTDDQNRERINAYIDGWMIKLNDRAKELQAQGLPAEEALDRATFDIRMEIRRAPTVDLD
jgi:hypothetical protein